MVFFDDLKDLTLYKKNVALPVSLNNIRHGSSIFLISPDLDASIRMLKAPYTVNKMNSYHCYYIEKNANYYINQEGCLEELRTNDDILNEATVEEVEALLNTKGYTPTKNATTQLSETLRSEIDPKDFGLPDKKKFPLDTPEHIKSAIKFFNYVDKDDEFTLATNIKKKAKEHGVVIRCGNKNRLSKYITEDYVKEFMNAGSIGNNFVAIANGTMKQAAHDARENFDVTDSYPYTKRKKDKKCDDDPSSTKQ